MQTFMNVCLAIFLLTMSLTAIAFTIVYAVIPTLAVLSFAGVL